MHSSPDRLQRLKGVHILLVEDEPDIADLLVFLFQTEGSTVSRCIDAETALSTLESVHPDLLVSNIKLPSHDGTWLIQQIRNHPCLRIQHLPALGVTSYDREVYACDALASGFNLFLSKLDSPDALVEAVSVLVALSH